MTYRLLEYGVLNLDTGQPIPPDPDNLDYAAYLAWVAAGNTAEPIEQPTAEQQAAEAAIQAERIDVSGLSAAIANELAWITTALTEIDTGLGLVDAATLAQLRAIVKGVLQNQRRILLEQQGELKAWRYVIRRLS